MLKYFITLSATFCIFSCTSSSPHYAEDMIRDYYDPDYALFCVADDPKCFGDTQTSDKIYDPYKFLPGFPVNPHKTDYFQRLLAEGSAEIARVDTLNSIWLTPFENDSRIIRLTSHYQQPDALRGSQFNALLLGTKPIGMDTPDLHRRVTVNLSRYLVGRTVNYRCFGLINSKQADCYIVINNELDIGEWMIKNGFLASFGVVPERYIDAQTYAETHENGFHRNSIDREAVIFPQVRKDRYGICHEASTLSIVILEGFYASYKNMSDCILSGGIQTT